MQLEGWGGYFPLPRGGTVHTPYSHPLIVAGQVHERVVHPAAVERLVATVQLGERLREKRDHPSRRPLDVKVPPQKNQKKKGFSGRFLRAMPYKATP